MANEYVPIFFDWVEVTEELTAQEKGRLIDAIVLYAQGGDWQEQIKGNERYLFPAFKKQIDRARATSEKRSIAGSARGKNEQTETNPSKVEQTETNTSKTPKEKEEEKEEDNKNKIKGDEVPPTPRKALKRFAPPTVEEVETYCRERGNGLDAHHFVDFYASKGWKVGNQPMKDWQAAVRTWEGRDSLAARSRSAQPGKQVQEQQYNQRVYDESEFNGLSSAQREMLEEINHAG